MNQLNGDLLTAAENASFDMINFFPRTIALLDNFPGDGYVWILSRPEFEVKAGRLVPTQRAKR